MDLVDVCKVLECAPVNGADSLYHIDLEPVGAPEQKYGVIYDEEVQPGRMVNVYTDGVDWNLDRRGEP